MSTQAADIEPKLYLVDWACPSCKIFHIHRCHYLYVLRCWTIQCTKCKTVYRLVTRPLDCLVCEKCIERREPTILVVEAEKDYGDNIRCIAR
jgi:hypothetical protein